MGTGSMRGRRSAAAAAALFVAAAALLLSRVGADPGPGEPFHIDEAHKLGESRYFHLFFVERDFGSCLWREDFFARVNPPVGKYVLGLALAAAGHPIRDGRLQDDFFRLWRDPARLRARVADGALRVGRCVSAVATAGLCALLFAGVAGLAGRVAGLAAVVLWCSHGVVLDFARLATTDALLCFHLGLAGLAAGLGARALVRFLARPPPDRDRRAWAGLLASAGLLPGLAIGLAAGVKPNGAVTALCLMGGLAVAAARGGEGADWPRRLGPASACLALAALSCVALFVACNPVYWDAPWATAVGTLRLYADWMDTQALDPGFPVFGPRQAGATLVHHLLLSPRLVFHGLPASLGGWGVLGLVLVGLGDLGRRAFVSGGDPADAARAATALAFGLALPLGVWLWLPVDWERYALPAYLSLCVLAGCGLAPAGRRVREIAAGLSGPARDGSAGSLAGGIRHGVRRAGPLAAWALAAWLLWPGGPLPRVLVPPARADLPVAAYGEPVRPGWTAILVRRHRGLAGLRAGGREAAARAAEDFEAALAALERFGPAHRDARLLRASLLWDRDRARIASGVALAPGEAAREHAAVFEALVRGLRSGDRRIAAHLERLSSRRRRWLEARAGGAPDPGAGARAGP